MINRLQLDAFGPIASLDWDHLGSINLVLGKNGCGKTFILKSLYTAIRTLEEYKRGEDIRSAQDILFEKLYWTFQPEKVGDLVSRGEEGPLRFVFELDGRSFSYTFGRDTSRQIVSVENHILPRKDTNSVFLPAKEVLSIYESILKSREIDKAFGYDDTYYELARALRTNPQRGKNVKEFAEARKALEDLFGGKVEFDEKSGKWEFWKGRQRFSIGMTAEGIKKVAILDRLLSNRYLNLQSVVFMDEPESALHPSALVQLLDIVADLAERGIQFFLASHSYFVVKKLFLIAQEKGMHIPVIMEGAEGWISADLLDGMPQNAIIDESVRLYEEEVNLAIG